VKHGPRVGSRRVCHSGRGQDTAAGARDGRLAGCLPGAALSDPQQRPRSRRSGRSRDRPQHTHWNGTRSRMRGRRGYGRRPDNRRPRRSQEGRSPRRGCSTRPRRSPRMQTWRRTPRPGAYRRRPCRESLPRRSLPRKPQKPLHAARRRTHRPRRRETVPSCIRREHKEASLRRQRGKGEGSWTRLEQAAGHRRTGRRKTASRV
jgi:hypothetical protein